MLLDIPLEPSFKVLVFAVSFIIGLSVGYWAGHDDWYRAGKADGYIKCRAEKALEEALEEAHKEKEPGVMTVDELSYQVQKLSSVMCAFGVNSAQLQHDLELSAKSIDNQWRIAKLSSIGFADDICKEISPDKNTYDYQRYLELQETVCKLLEFGVEPNVVLSAAESKVLDALLYALQNRGPDYGL